MNKTFEFKSLDEGRSGGFAYSCGALLILAASFLFTIVLSVIFGGTENVASQGVTSRDWYRYISFLIPVVCYSVGIIFLASKTKTPVKKIYKGCKWYYYLIAVLLQFGLFSLSAVNEQFLSLLKKIGFSVSSEVAIPSLEGFGLFGVLLCVAVLPAVCEETLFRGVILNSLKGGKQVFAVLVCGALFSLFHQSPAQTVYQFLCGSAFALVAIRSGSVLPTVLSHFLNNALIIILAKFGYANITLPGAALAVSAVALIGTLAFLIFVDKNGKSEKRTDRREFFTYALPGIAVCAVMWVAGLF